MARVSNKVFECEAGVIDQLSQVRELLRKR